VRGFLGGRGAWGWCGGGLVWGVFLVGGFFEQRVVPLCEDSVSGSLCLLPSSSDQGIPCATITQDLRRLFFFL